MNKQKERGQALVILVFALVAVTAMAGLAIDAGRLFTLRRQAQIAADAAAIAGTRQLAFYIAQCETGSNDAVWGEIVGSARNNGADESSPDVALSGRYVDKDENELNPATGAPPIGATGVRVSVTLTETTTLLKIVGQEFIVASTEATAMTGPIRQFAGGGLLPIGFSADAVDSLIDSGTLDFKMHDTSGAICNEDSSFCPSEPSAQSSRGWLYFDYIFNVEFNAGGNLSHPMNRVISTNFANPKLRDWAVNGSPHPLFAGTRRAGETLFTDGDFIVGITGARPNALADICKTHMHKTVYLPLFDYIEQQPFMRANFPNDEPPNPVKFPSGQFLYFHIVGFMAADLNTCTKNTMGGEFQYAMIGEGLIDPTNGYQGSGACDATPVIMGVMLWR